MPARDSPGGCYARGPVFVYKQNPYRSVVLDDSGAVACVRKRFHHPSRWRALRDAARARGEFRALQLYERLGLPVPRPLELSPARPTPNFSMQLIEGAQSLEALLLGGRPPVPWEQLMERLGLLLARMQEQRILHPDLHPGNLLVAPDGALYLVDLRGSRLQRRAFSTAQKQAALVAAEAEARDYLAPAMRMRFVAAWRRASHDPGCMDLERIAREALARRRDYVEHGAGRWIRRSSRCNVEVTPAGLTFTAKLHPGFRSAALSPGEGLLRVEGKTREVRRGWLLSARCVEHRLPVVWPLELAIHGAAARATYALASSPGLALGSAAEEGLQDAIERFAERGLELENPQESDLLPLEAGGFLMGPPKSLEHLS